MKLTQITLPLSPKAVSLPDGRCIVLVRILRDTGAAQSYMLSGVLPLSDNTSTGIHVLVREFEMSLSLFKTGEVVVGVRQSLPVPGISLILGNDLAGGKVWCNKEAVSPTIVLSNLVAEVPLKPDQCSRRQPGVFPSCAVTRAVVKRGIGSDFVSLEYTFLVHLMLQVVVPHSHL